MFILLSPLDRRISLLINITVYILRSLNKPSLTIPWQANFMISISKSGRPWLLIGLILEVTSIQHTCTCIIKASELYSEHFRISKTWPIRYFSLWNLKVVLTRSTNIRITTNFDVAIPPFNLTRTTTIYNLY